MENFIEVIEKTGNTRVILPLSKILSISQCRDLTAFIETGVDAKGMSTGLFTTELFVEIKKKIQQVVEIV